MITALAKEKLAFLMEIHYIYKLYLKIGPMPTSTLLIQKELTDIFEETREGG